MLRPKLQHFPLVNTNYMCNIMQRLLLKKEEYSWTYINSLTAIPPGQVRDAEDGGEEVEQGPGNNDAVVDV